MTDPNRKPRLPGIAVLLAFACLWAAVFVLARARRALETSAQVLAEQNAELAGRAAESDRLWVEEADRADELAAQLAAASQSLARTEEAHLHLEQEFSQDHIAAAFRALESDDLAELAARLERVPDTHVGWEWMYLDLRLGLALQRVEAHEDAVSAIARSSDGQRIASGARDGGVRIWDESFGEPLFEYELDEEVTALALDESGSTIVAGLRSGVIVAWTADEWGTEIALWEGRPRPSALTLFPAGERVACGFDDGSVAVWDLSVEEPQWLAGHADVVNALAVSGDGTQLASSSDDNTVQVYSDAEFAEMRVLAGHTDWVNCLAFSPDASHIVSGSEDETIRIWDTATGTELERTEPDHGPIRQVALRAGDELSFVTELGYVEDQRGRERHTLRIPLDEYELLGLALLAPDGSRLVFSAGDESVRIWRGDVPPSVVHRPTESSVSCVTSNDERIVVGCRRGLVLVLDSETGGELDRLQAGKANVLSVALSPDGLRLAAGCEDGTALLWELATGELLHSFDWTPRITSVALTEEHLLAVGRDGSSRLWKTEGGELVRGSPAPRTAVFAACAANDAANYVWVGDAGTIRVWDAATGARTAALRDRTLGRIETVRLNPDGSRLAVIESGWRFVLFDLENGESLTRAGEIERSAHVLALDPTGGRHLTGGFGGAVSLWNSSTGAHLFDLDTGDDPIHALAFTADGARILVGTGSGLQIWESDADALEALRR